MYVCAYGVTACVFVYVHAYVCVNFSPNPPEYSSHKAHTRTHRVKMDHGCISWWINESVDYGWLAGLTDWSMDWSDPQPSFCFRGTTEGQSSSSGQTYRSRTRTGGTASPAKRYCVWIVSDVLHKSSEVQYRPGTVRGTVHALSQIYCVGALRYSVGTVRGTVHALSQIYCVGARRYRVGTMRGTH